MGIKLPPKPLRLLLVSPFLMLYIILYILVWVLDKIAYYLDVFSEWIWKDVLWKIR